MQHLQVILRILDSTLQLNGRSQDFTPETRLLGALPEFDSMAVLALVAGLESHYGITFQDEQLTGEQFSTVRSLCELVQHSLPTPRA